MLDPLVGNGFRHKKSMKASGSCCFCFFFVKIARRRWRVGEVKLDAGMQTEKVSPMGNK